MQSTGPSELTIPSIRGGFGYQILGVIGHLSNDLTYSEFDLNIGNHGNVDVDHNWVGEIFPELKVNKTVGFGKFNFFEKSSIDKVIETLPKIREVLVPYVPNVNCDKLLVVRQRDRFVVSMDKYLEIYERFDPDLIISDGNIPELNYVNEINPVLDWTFCYRSKQIVSGFSSFPLSAALLNPHVDLSFIKKEDSERSNLVSDKDWDCLDYLVSRVDNLHWWS